MPRRAIHNATVTLKLPSDIGATAEIAALQAAGIPVDVLGNAQRGFLFVRFGKAQGSPANIFRWFAGEVGQAPG
jgi:hypothetical protein